MTERCRAPPARGPFRGLPIYDLLSGDRRAGGGVAGPWGDDACQTLVPLADDSPWSAAFGPAHLPWLFLDDPPEPWPAATLPDVWIMLLGRATLAGAREVMG